MLTLRMVAVKEGLF